MELKNTNNYCHFKNQIKHYQQLFDMGHWQITVRTDECEDARATTYMGCLSEGGQQASIYASKLWLNDESTTLFAIERTAFHEICEIFLHKLRWYAQNTDKLVTNREIGVANHEIIRTLENKIFPLIKRTTT